MKKKLLAVTLSAAMTAALLQILLQKMFRQTQARTGVLILRMQMEKFIWNISMSNLR